MAKSWGSLSPRASWRRSAGWRRCSWVWSSPPSCSARCAGKRVSSFHDAGTAGAMAVPVFGPMRPREVRLRAHLHETRGGALELLRLEAFVGGIERVRLRRGRSDQLHIHVVECVDEDDEALRGVAR